MPSSLTYRPLTVADLPAALELWKRSPGVHVVVGDDEATLQRYLERNLGCSFVACEGDLVVGTVLGGHDGRRGLLYHLAVASTHRRLGIGRNLVERSLEALRAQGIARSFIMVLADNTDGKAFWHQLGFEDMDGVDALSIDL